MQAQPEDAVRYEVPAALTSARLDYAFHAATAGTYYVWVRALGPNTSSDSVHMGLNGSATTSSVQLGNFYPTGSLVWRSGKRQPMPGGDLANRADALRRSHPDQRQSDPAAALPGPIRRPGNGL